MRSGALEGFEVHSCGVGFGLLVAKESGRMGSSPKRNLRSIGPMPPSSILSSLILVILS
jgi:hypothetical protein